MAFGRLIKRGGQPSSARPTPDWLSFYTMQMNMSHAAVLQRKRSRNFAQALIAVSVCLTALARQLRHKLRAITSDRYAAQLAAERRLVQDRGDELAELACGLRCPHGCELDW